MPLTSPLGAKLASIRGVGARFQATGAWHREAPYAGSAPINLAMLAQTYQHGLVQTLPDAIAIPVTLTVSCIPCHVLSPKLTKI